MRVMRVGQFFLDRPRADRVRRDEQLIPAIIERGVEPPSLVQHFTRFDLTAVDTAVPRLLKQLGLEKKPVSTPSASLDYGSLPARG